MPLVRARTMLSCVALLGLAACSDATDAGPSGGADAQDTVAPGEPDAAAPGSVTVALDVTGLAADACEEVTLQATAAGAVGPVRWEVGGLPLLAVDLVPGTPDAIRFRAPAYADAYELTIRAVAHGAGGDTAQAEATVTVGPGPLEPTGTPGTSPGCAPFAEGVTSGDPHPDSVLLWTRVTSDQASEPLTYVVATDPLLRDVVAEGAVDALAERDHTVTVDVPELSPWTTYYYRFFDVTGAGSALGRTKTAPDGPVDEVTLASMSCSSLFSGWFNAYQRLAEHSEVDLVVHLGDYLYDFVDAEEQVRVGDPYPDDPFDVATWRDRFRLYLSDPALRAARAAHPWFVLWDNHDAHGGADDRPVSVWHEYVPNRIGAAVSAGDDVDPQQAWRALRYGGLLEVRLVDVLTRRESKDAPGGLFGAEQWGWLSEGLAASETAWRVVGMQKLFTELAGADAVGDPSIFDDYPASRTALVDALGAHDGNVVLSGDLHFTLAADVVDRPTDVGNPYEPEADDGRSVGVELLAAGISRGNFDERLCGGLCGEGSLFAEIIASLPDELKGVNPHAVHYELIEHGYGALTFTADRVHAQVRYSPIREWTDAQTFSPTLVSERTANRWTRD